MKEVDSLFLDSKRSVKRLTENKDKYLSSLVCYKQLTKTTNYISFGTQPLVFCNPSSLTNPLLILCKPTIHRIRSHSLHINNPSHSHLITPTRSPFSSFLIINHTVLLMFLDTLGLSVLLPLCLHLLWNRLLTRNLCFPLRKSCLEVTSSMNPLR